MKARFQERVKESVDVDELYIWSNFKSDILKVCDEVCGKKKGRRNHGDMWWWNEEVKQAIRQKKKEFKKMYENRSKGNKAEYKNMKNLAKSGRSFYDKRS